MNRDKRLGTEHLASAKAQNIPVSTKHSVEISRHLRYKKTTFAKSFLEDVIRLRKAVPFYRFDQDLGHKAGMAAGRFPQKAAKEFLRLVKSVEANAQSKGLNSSALKITKILANKASIPLTGGRHRRGTKRTHLEIEVREISAKKEKREKAEEKPKLEPQKNIPAIRGEEGRANLKGQPSVAGKVPEKIPEAVKTVPKQSKVKLEEHQKIVPEAKIEEKAALKRELQPEIISKTEPKKELNFQSKPQFKSSSLSEQKLNAEAKSLDQNITQNTRRPEEPSSAELLRRAQERAAQLNKHEKEEQKRVKEVNDVESLFNQLKQKGSLRDQTGGKKR